MKPKPWKVTQILYAPWTWGVFIPYLLGSTVFWGSVALLLAVVSHRIAFHCGTIWAWCLCRVNWTTVEITGKEHASRGQVYVIMMNHQSHFDILAFYGHWGRQFRWVMKRELRNVPFLGWATAAMGNIFIDRSNREKTIASLREAGPLFDQGISVMIFPEGTRSGDGPVGPFKKGGFMMALNTGLPILPVSIRGTRSILPRKTKRLTPGRVQITVHRPIETAGLTADDRNDLMFRVRAALESAL